MKLIGTFNIQYANCLLAEKRMVLRGDRDRGDEVKLDLYTNETSQVLTINITEGIRIEKMRTNPSAGNKKRLDIYLFDYQLDDVIAVLEKFVSSQVITFDVTERAVPDPTGMEHPNGLELGEIQTITSIDANYVVYLISTESKIEGSSKLYIEAERKKGNKFHIGSTLNSDIKVANMGESCIQLDIAYKDTKRLLNSMKLTKKLLM